MCARIFVWIVDGVAGDDTAACCAAHHDARAMLRVSCQFTTRFGKCNEQSIENPAINVDRVISRRGVQQSSLIHYRALLAKPARHCVLIACDELSGLAELRIAGTRIVRSCDEVAALV
jgi:hypothetical protein